MKVPSTPQEYFRYASECVSEQGYTEMVKRHKLIATTKRKLRRALISHVIRFFYCCLMILLQYQTTLLNSNYFNITVHSSMEI